MSGRFVQPARLGLARVLDEQWHIHDVLKSGCAVAKEVMIAQPLAVVATERSASVPVPVTCNHRWVNSAYVGTDPSSPEARSSPRTPTLPPLRA